MVAEVREKRMSEKSSRQIAQAAGCAPETVRRKIAEPRYEFIARAAARRAEVVRLRAEGLTFPQIAEHMGKSVGAVTMLAQRAKKAKASPDVCASPVGED